MIPHACVSPTRQLFPLFAALLLAGLGCGDNPAQPDGGTDGALADAGIDSGSDVQSDSQPPADGSTDSGLGCPRVPASADRPRAVVVSHPYAGSGSSTNPWEVLTLTTTGTLERPGIVFTMGTAMEGEVVFTPDGEVGIAVQKDGTLGVFRLHEDGTPSVVHEAFKGSFYAERVILDPSGSGIFVLDAEWRTNGGGIYRVSIGCDGSLVEDGLVAPAKLPRAMVALPERRAVVAAHDLLDSPEGADVHLLESLAPASLAASVDAFPAPPGGSDEQIVSCATVTADGKYVLVGDNSEFHTVGEPSIAVVEVLPLGLKATQLFAFNDPVSLVASPFGQPVLAVSGYGNAIYILDYAPDGSVPFSVRGKLPVHGDAPQLPSTAVMVSRGSLTGLVLVAEVSGVRRVQFRPDGTVQDLGLYNLGSGYDAMVGALGVQP